MAIFTALAARREAIVEAWLGRLLDDYAAQGARFLRTERDPFRNPVGRTFGDHLPAIVEQVVGPMDRDRIRPALEAIVRIRAVQDESPSRALGFVFALKAVFREALAAEAAVQTADEWYQIDGRIDEVGLLAFDLLLECRERLYEIRTNEARRRVHVLERMLQQPAADSPPEPTDRSDEGA